MMMSVFTKCVYVRFTFFSRYIYILRSIHRSLSRFPILVSIFISWLQGPIFIVCVPYFFFFLINFLSAFRSNTFESVHACTLDFQHYWFMSVFTLSHAAIQDVSFEFPCMCWAVLCAVLSRQLNVLINKMCNPLWSCANQHTCLHAFCLLSNPERFRFLRPIPRAIWWFWAMSVSLWLADCLFYFQQTPKSNLLCFRHTFHEEELDSVPIENCTWLASMPTTKTGPLNAKNV